MNSRVILLIEGSKKRLFQHEQQKSLTSAADFSVKVCPGQLVSLTGPAGSGKSSVLKAVNRKDLPTGGRIIYRMASGDLEDMASADESRVLEVRKSEIRFVTQSFQAFPHQSASGCAIMRRHQIFSRRSEGIQTTDWSVIGKYCLSDKARQ